MPFKKGHPGYNKGGYRKKKSTPRRNLSSDNTTGRETMGYKQDNAIDKFPITKEWDTSSRYKQLDPELVDYYINNDLDVTELFDNLKSYRTEEEIRSKNKKYARKYYGKGSNKDMS
jgi:hypothetical protein